jgi:hypothetical protein
MDKGQVPESDGILDDAVIICTSYFVPSSSYLTLWNPTQPSLILETIANDKQKGRMRM